MTTHPTIAKYREELKLPGGATIILDADLAALLDAYEAAADLAVAVRRLAGNKHAADCVAINSSFPSRPCNCGFQDLEDAIVPVERSLARLGGQA